MDHLFPIRACDDEGEKALLEGVGDDILEARCSVAQVTPVNEAKLTRIPYGTPYVQTGIGSGIGVKTVTGSVTAVTMGTALAWGQAMR